MSIRPDLLLLLCDTARADAFRPWGGPVETPAMDRLFREGLAYRHATAQAPWTLPSTASIFSGRLPTEHGISGDYFRWRGERPTSQAEAIRSYQGAWLSEALHQRGYRTRAASCNVWVSPWGGFDRGFETFVHLYDGNRLPKGRFGTVVRRGVRLYGKVDKGGRQALQHVERWIAEPDPRPLFAFVNLMEVHAPYDPPRPYFPYAFWRRARTRRLSGGSRTARRILKSIEFREPPSEYVRTIQALYYAAARYEDWLLGRFVEMIQDRDGPTVVAIVADHGENLGEHGLFNHNSSLGQTLLHVPLVVWGQGTDVGPGVVEQPVSLLGLADWLVGFADGTPKPIAPDGPVVSEYESAVRHTRIDSDLEARQEASDGGRLPSLVRHPGVAVRRGQLKYVAVENGEEALYDLEADPREEHDILAWRPEAAEEFRPLREAWRARRSALPTHEASEEVAEGEIEEHLRALGYIE